MALKENFSQYNNYGKDISMEEEVVIEKNKNEEVIKEKAKPKKDSSKKHTKKTSDSLTKMKTKKENKSVRKSFMFTETANNNLMRYAELTDRKPNDFLNELLTNLDEYLS